MHPKDMTNAGIASHLEKQTSTGIFKELPRAFQRIYFEAIERLKLPTPPSAEPEFEDGPEFEGWEKRAGIEQPDSAAPKPTDSGVE